MQVIPRYHKDKIGPDAGRNALFDPQTNVVDVLVSRLRSKIDKGFETKLIHTVRGVGYVLKAEG